MREFRCNSLGYECNWKHIARTEDLLADIAAIHLRDVHGIRAVDAETVAKIKNHFLNPSPVEVSEAESLVMKEYNCTLGPGCTWRYIAMTEDLIVDGVSVHARGVHGIKEFTPALIAKIKKSLHEWDLMRERERRAA